MSRFRIFDFVKWEWKYFDNIVDARKYAVSQIEKTKNPYKVSILSGSKEIGYVYSHDLSYGREKAYFYRPMRHDYLHTHEIYKNGKTS